MNIRCEKSPSGEHCYHPYVGPWMSVNPPPVTCCHCGRDQKNEHGPFLKKYGGL